MAAPDSPLQPFFRLVIMTGTVVVGGMAVKVYGPPPEKLGPLLDHAMAMVQELAGRFDAAPAEPQAAPVGASPPGPSPSAPPLVAAPAFALTPVGPDSPSADPPLLVSAATPSANGPPTSSPTTSGPPTAVPPSLSAAVAADPELGVLVSQLRTAGAQSLQLTPWGADGRYVRCACSAPTGVAGFVRQLDAVGESPRRAVERLLDQLRLTADLAQVH